MTEVGHIGVGTGTNWCQKWDTLVSEVGYIGVRGGIYDAIYRNLSIDNASIGGPKLAESRRILSRGRRNGARSGINDTTYATPTNIAGCGAVNIPTVPAKKKLTYDTRDDMHDKSYGI